MNRAEKRFRIYAVLALFLLLAVLLALINCVSFTKAAEDGDKVTQMLADQHGAFAAVSGAGGEPWAFAPQGRRNMGPMGPDSPELSASMRYFTAAFDQESGALGTVAFHLSAIAEEEAVEWASTLLGRTTGWTRGTYRYRVYTDEELTYVTVIDQGRELISAYRILRISAIGLVLATLAGWLFLRLAGRRIFAPLEEADRKQQGFLAGAEKNLKLPLTVISANTELIERRSGPDEQTASIRRQVKALSELVEGLGGLSLFRQEGVCPEQVQLADMLRSALGGAAERFASKGLRLEANIPGTLALEADRESMKRIVDELVDNALRYGRTWAAFRLSREGDRVILLAENDTDLPEGSVDQAFDRFTTLENADGGTAGLGLAYVRELVLAQHGRVNAQVQDGAFRLRIAL